MCAQEVVAAGREPARSLPSRRPSPDVIGEHREAPVGGAADVALRIGGECILVSAPCLGGLPSTFVSLAEVHEPWGGLPLVRVRSVARRGNC